VANVLRLAPAHNYLVFVPEGAGYEGQAPVGGRVAFVAVPQRGLIARMEFERRVLPADVARFQPDLVWGLGNYGLSHPPCRQAILVQDAHLVYPKRHFQSESWSLRFKKHLVRRRLRACLPRTEIVFCQTDTVRRRFIDFFGYRGRVCLCPNAVSESVRLPDHPRVPELLQPFADRFKLFVLTAYYAHKNIEGVVAMYKRFRERLAGTVCFLTIEASQSPKAERLLGTIRKAGLEKLIVNLGPLRQEKLAEHYLACDCLFLPTFLESFSGTYLEAMHFGRPILTSDLDFAHDVCGDAALYFDPWDCQAMSNAVVQLAESADLRRELVEKGRPRLAQMFRAWPDVVRQAMDDLGVSHE
jgi:glycosyltransferase involved in cell wall biosynthesis